MTSDEWVDAYIRLSRESDDSASIDTQRASVRRWCELNGHDPQRIREHIDSGVSGAKPLEHRAGMKALMAARPTVVVAWKLDRYARSVSEFLRLVEWAEKTNVRLVTTDNTINTTTPTGRMVATVLAALAEWERGMISNRITDGHATRRSQGRWGSGRPPFGYKIVRIDGAAYLAVDEVQAELITKAVRKLLTGGSVAGTARIVGLSEPQWRRMVKGRSLRGQRLHRGKLVVGADGITPVQFADPIVSAAEAKKIRERLTALATGQDRAPRQETPMCSGMAWCYQGCKLNGGTSDKGILLYRCKAGHVTIYQETVDQAVTEQFKTTWGGFAEYHVKLEGGNDLTEQIAEAQEQAGRLAERMKTAGPLMFKTLEDMSSELEDTYANLLAEHDPEVRQVLVPSGRTLGEAWDDPDERPRLLESMGLRVTLHPKQRTPRLDIEWAGAVDGGDDQELVDMLYEMEERSA